MIENPQQGRLIIVAILTIAPNALAQFREFEDRAADIVARHGGELERTIAAEPSGTGELREVHILSFPSQQAFDRYRADADLTSLSELRSLSIAHTEVLLGREGPHSVST